MSDLRGKRVVSAVSGAVVSDDGAGEDRDQQADLRLARRRSSSAMSGSRPVGRNSLVTTTKIAPVMTSSRNNGNGGARCCVVIVSTIYRTP